ncbi:MAG: HAMP domain-containing histidine kinase [Desulfobacterota bacterium]|nr:HAMP domain-containing histidine kinase [Thermodesulfobacteriota bacterium]
MKREIRLFKTVSSRLALWYAVLFTTASLFSFMAIYFMLSSILMERENDELVAELREFGMLYHASGMEMLRPVIIHEAESEGVNRVFIRITNRDNMVVAASDMRNWEDVPLSSGAGIPWKGVQFETFSSRRHPHGIRMAHQMLGDGNVITIGMNTEGDKAFLSAFIEMSLTVMVLAVLIGSITGWYISKKAMLGVERVRLTASSIGRGDTSSRVPLGEEGEEIQSLATTFNSMLDRIDVLISDLKEVSNNIAHELRSPLTRIRVVAESALIENRSQEMAALVLEECDTLSGIINTMLEIAETDAGVIRLAREKVNLTGLVGRAHDLFLAVADEKGISFELDMPSSDLFIQGDTARLQRCISNLLDNALKFTHAGGRVVIAGRERSGHVEILVSDTGEGIEEKDLPHIFEKFYRSDKSRSTPGNGLGLSLVRSIVKAHNGEVSVKSDPGEGTSFTVILPAAR